MKSREQLEIDIGDKNDLIDDLGGQLSDAERERDELEAELVNCVDDDGD